MTTHKHINEEVIDNIIEYLQTIKHDRCDITIVPPHIEEIFGDIETMYGTVQMDIHIQFNELYKRAREIVANWEKVRK